MVLEGKGLPLKFLRLNGKATDYDVTIFQTLKVGEKKGYRPVYRITVRGKNHQDVHDHVFRLFNIAELYRQKSLGRGILCLSMKDLEGNLLIN